MENEKIKRKIAGLQASLDSGKLNARAAARVQRSLSRLAYENPAEAGSLGIAADQSITRVYEYGVLLSDCSLRSENLETPDPTNPLTAMRLRIAYYNTLIAAAKPLLEERRLHLSGPEQTQLSVINEQISAKYSAIRQINQLNRKRVKSEEIDKLLTEIAELKKTRMPLWERARTELYANLKYRKADLSEIEHRLFKLHLKRIRKAFGPKGKGLWHGNYAKTDEEFRTAWRRVCQSPSATLHYRYEQRDGSPPNDLASWPGWDGEGAITISNSQNYKPKDTVSIFSGTNARIAIAKLDERTWKEMGGDPRYLERDTSRLYVCKLRIGSKGKGSKEPIWARMVFVMHRPLPLDASIVEASLVRKRLGFKHVETLSICVATRVRPHRISGRRVTFTLGTFPTVATWTDDTGDHGSLCLPVDILVSMQKIPLFQAILSRYENAVRAHVDALGTQIGPIVGAELNIHSLSRNRLARCYEIQSKIFDAKLCAKWKKQVRGELKKYEANDEQTIVDGVDKAVHLIAPLIQEQSGLDDRQAAFFATLLIFHERYKRFNSVITGLREHKLRHRVDVYRKFANEFKDVMTFVLPKSDLHASRAFKSKMLVSPSELIKVLEQFAKREGIRIEYVKHQT